MLGEHGDSPGHIKYHGILKIVSQVPLQYSDPTAGEAQVAIAMAPSSLPHDSPAYLGPLLFNPGRRVAEILTAAHCLLND